MQRHSTAGGFFLVAPIVTGFFIGLATGDAMRGVLIGTVAGLGLLAALWLRERSRGG